MEGPAVWQLRHRLESIRCELVFQPATYDSQIFSLADLTNTGDDIRGAAAFLVKLNASDDRIDSLLELVRPHSDGIRDRITKAVSVLDWLYAKVGPAAIAAVAADLPAPITKDTAAVLSDINERMPILSSLEDIEHGADLAKQTVKASCDKLIESGLAERPLGNRNGIGLTPAGVALANQLSTKLDRV